MKTIIFDGWEIGMKKISFYKMLKANSHLSLKESKSVSDRLLQGEIIEIEFETENIAKLIVEESQKFGVKCRLADKQVIN